MLTREDLSHYSLNHPPTNDLKRTRKVSNEYALFKADEDARRDFLMNITRQLQISESIAHANAFPYSVEEGLIHYLIWTNMDIDIDEINSYIRYLVYKHFGGEDIVCFWVNLPKNRSMPEIPHIHVFIDIRC